MWPKFVEVPELNSKNMLKIKSDDFNDIGFYYFQVRGISDYGHQKDFNFTLIILDGCESAEMSIEYESTLETAFVGRKAVLTLFNASLEYPHCDYITYTSEIIRCDGLHREINCNMFISVKND